MLSSLSNTNHTASGTKTGIARRLAQLVSTLAQIIGAAMHDNRAAQDALRPDQFDLLVRDGALCVSLAVGFKIAEIADVAFAVGGGAVGFGERIDWERRRRRIVLARRSLHGLIREKRRWVTVGSGACAAVGVVAELVDVHAALGRGIVAADFVGDGRWGGLGRLLKGDGAADLGVTAQDCDCVGR